MPLCSHLEEVVGERDHSVKPSSRGCQECLATGGSWVHLRLCLACGHVGCCDSSPSKHATGHWRAAHHPVIKSFEPEEDWAWCYADEKLAEEIPTFPEESPARHYAPPAP
jgi:hypothetical protein